MKFINSFFLLSFLVLHSCKNNESIIDDKSSQFYYDSIKKVQNGAIGNELKIRPFEYDTTKQYVYLTFDDGPQKGTQECFNACKEQNIKSTFFMVGLHASSPSLVKMVNDIRLSYPQALLANHSFTHARGKYKYFYSNEQMAAEDFYKAQTTLNVPFKIIRLPGNNAWVLKDRIKAKNNTSNVCVILDSANYNVLGWDVEWDFRGKSSTPIQSAEKMYNQVKEALDSNETMFKNHVVILTHDRMFKNEEYTNRLVSFIKMIKQNPKYVFETIDHYPNLKASN